MIKNFDELKNQLEELAKVVNAFKSEAVQLRIVELVFNVEAESVDEEPTSNSGESKRSSKPRRSRKKSSGPSESKEASAKKPAKAGKGPSSFLTALVEDGFFKEPKQLRDIVEYAKDKKGRIFKQSDFSGRLARLVREDVLDREKVDGNYTYKKA